MEQRQVPGLEFGTWTLYLEAVTVHIVVCADLFNGTYLEEGRVNGILLVQLFAVESAILVPLFPFSPACNGQRFKSLVVY